MGAVYMLKSILEYRNGVADLCSLLLGLLPEV